MNARIKVEMNLFSNNNDKSMVILFLFLFFPFSFNLSRMAMQVGPFEGEKIKIKVTQNIYYSDNINIFKTKSQIYYPNALTVRDIIKIMYVV